ncbi:MAG: helix-turn-helix domain-containing protein [Actinomycetota bacterium]|nr:helix-turn-helix domain-containing protein [Actinomycetota bacterium]
MDLPHLRDLRRRAVMSQEQLAEKSGVARDTISKLETGRRKAYPTTIRKLAAGLNTAPQMLVGGVEYLEPEQAKGSEEGTEKEPREGRKVGF